MLKLKRWGLFKRPLPWIGFERSTVYIGQLPYLDRWIVYTGFGTLRLHKFWRGDDDRASHTHPWWFITFPLSSYVEEVFKKGVSLGYREVKAWRPHFRAANFEHIVIGRGEMCACGCGGVTTDPKPFFTLVLTGNRSNGWGFYPEPSKFIPWREYK